MDWTIFCQINEYHSPLFDDYLFNHSKGHEKMAEGMNNLFKDLNSSVRIEYKKEEEGL